MKKPIHSPNWDGSRNSVLLAVYGFFANIVWYTFPSKYWSRWFILHCILTDWFNAQYSLVYPLIVLAPLFDFVVVANRFAMYMMRNVHIEYAFNSRLGTTYCQYLRLCYLVPNFYPTIACTKMDIMFLRVQWRLETLDSYRLRQWIVDLSQILWVSISPREVNSVMRASNHILDKYEGSASKPLLFTATKK